MKTVTSNAVPKWHLWSLAIVVLALGAGIAEQSHRLSRARVELTSLTTKRLDQQKKAAQESYYRDVQREQAEALDRHQKKIPFVDGYVWLSKFLRETAPGLQLTVHPPEMNAQEIIAVPEFCTGTFRIRGSGGSEDMLHLLRKIEGDLSFTHIQDIHFIFTDEKRSSVQFSLTLLTIMRLHDGPDSIMHAATSDFQTTLQ